MSTHLDNLDPPHCNPWGVIACWLAAVVAIILWACSSGCTRIHIDRTATEFHADYESCLSDKKLGPTVFVHRPDGTWMAATAGYNSEVNVPAVQAVTTMIGTVAGVALRTALLGVP